MSVASDFINGVLSGLGLPQTQANQDFITAWANREGGGGENNPLNTTLRVNGSSSLAGNSAGVQNYPTLQTGISATVQTLQSPLYADIRKELATGDANTSAVLSGLSTWSRGGYDTLSGTNGTQFNNTSLNASTNSGEGVEQTASVSGVIGDLENPPGAVLSLLTKPVDDVKDAFHGIDTFFTDLLWFFDPVNEMKIAFVGVGILLFIAGGIFIVKEVNS